MIRRFALLLVLTLASAVSVAEELPPPGDGSSAAPELTAAGVEVPGAVIRSSGRVLTTGYLAGSGAGRRPWPRGGLTEAIDAPRPALSTPTAITDDLARNADVSSRGYAASLALARAGLLSSPSTAPPPFQSV